MSTTSRYRQADPSYGTDAGYGTGAGQGGKGYQLNPFAFYRNAKRHRLLISEAQGV